MLVPKVLAQVVTPPPIVISQPPNVHITSIGQLIQAAVGVLLLISALLAFVYLILGGLQWITSGGDKAGMEAARNKITHAIVGLIIVAAAYAIMTLAAGFLGLSLTNLQIPTPF